MTNKISRLIKRITEEPFPNDGSLYDLGLDDGKLYQTTDGYTFHAVGDVSLLQNGCCDGNGVCSTTLKVPTTTTTSNDLFADIVGYTDIKREFNKALESTSPVCTD